MINEIREKLSAYVPVPVQCASSIRAGVVIPLFEKDGDCQLLLTKRSDDVRYHKGEISFPGGMYETGDGDLMNTALRECAEEIGVSRDDCEVIGRLDDVYTITGFVITPFVGIIPYPYEFRTNPQEVQYIITLPYSYLKSAPTVKENTVYGGKQLKFEALEYNGDRIWGATCRMLMRFQLIVEGNGNKPE